MQIAARTAAWAKSGYTAKDYVQDGLVAMWDGIENAGSRVHDPNATVWKDLVGDRDANIVDTSANLFWDEDALVSNGGSFGYMARIDDDISFVSAEAVVSWTSGNRNVFKPRNGFRALDYSNGIWRCGYGQDGAFQVQMSPGKTISLSYSLLNTTASINDPILLAYVDGNEITSRAASWHSNSSTDYTYIGGSNADWTRWDGGIMCIRLYSRALTAAEIAANYAVDKVRFGLT